MGEIVGGSFTGRTVTTKMLLVKPKFVSVTETVMAAVPDWLGAGVTVTMRLAPLPSNTMLPSGTRLVLEEVAATVSRFAGVLASPTVKASGPATVSSLIDWLPNPERVGGELPVD